MPSSRPAKRRITLLLSFLVALAAGVLVGTAPSSGLQVGTIPTRTIITVPHPPFFFCLSSTSTDGRGNGCGIGQSGEVTKDVTSYTNTGDPTPSCRAGSLRTAWYQMTGTGHRIHLTTANSNYDTVLAIFPHGTATSSVACDDDGGPGATSDLSFASTAGAAYDVMVGQYSGSSCAPTCNLVLGRDPDNDDRANGTALAPSDTTAVNDSVNTKYADAQAGEHLSCTPSGGTAHTTGQTVWYHVSTGGNSGLLELFATGFSTAVSVYPHGTSTTPVACGAGSSNDLKVHVPAGTYDVQVGGDGATTSGALALHTTFASDNDQDKDGFISKALGGNDCNDHSASIHPGATDTPNDHIDQNCDGHDAIDADHDGVDAPPDGADCNDHSAAIHPGAKDVPGDKIDQDCSGKDAKFPRLGSNAEIHYLFFPHYTKLTVLNILKAKKGSKVKLTCKGKGCPFKSKSVKVKKNASKLKLAKLVEKGRFAQSAKLIVQLTSSGHIGSVLTFTFRNVKAPTKKTQCLMPGKKKPQKKC